MGDLRWATKALVPPSARLTRALAISVPALVGLALCAGPARAAPSDRALVNEYAGIEEAHLGEKLPGGPAHFITVVDSSVYSKTVHLYGKTFTEGAGTSVQWNAGGTEAIGAVITIYRLAHSRGEGVLRGVIAHEVFHVFEARMSVSRAVDDSHEGWLEEGAATWVESELVPNDETARMEWREYLKAPTVPLYKRAYEAVGFFGHMTYEGISPWSRFKAMFTTTSFGAAYAAAIASNVRFLQDEGSVFFRERGLGPEWEQTGRNVPSAGEVRFKPPTVTVSASAHNPLTAPSYGDTADVLEIASLPRTTPILEVNLVKGHGRLRSTGAGAVNLVDPSKLLLCSEPKYCECPQHPYNFPQFKRGNVALDGGPTGGEIEFKLRKPCEELISAPSCERLLPEFGPLISSIAGKSTAVETRQPDGTTDSACAFLYKGQLEGNPETEEYFVGAIAVVVNVLRASSYGGAIRVFQATSKLPGAYTLTRPGIGEEAVLYTIVGAGPRGPEYGSDTVVRVRNVVASYSLLSANGSTEADPKHSLALLELVAHRL
ncbi:MAG TPA: hypothetical protein VKG38_14975 [Solirubrobacteraceae bacterium]|nr:hypothetical protein [Solirubrobacteraceae bacterium]